MSVDLAPAFIRAEVCSVALKGKCASLEAALPAVVFTAALSKVPENLEFFGQWRLYSGNDKYNLILSIESFHS